MRKFMTASQITREWRVKTLFCKATRNRWLIHAQGREVCGKAGADKRKGPGMSCLSKRGKMTRWTYCLASLTSMLECTWCSLQAHTLEKLL